MDAATFYSIIMGFIIGVAFIVLILVFLHMAYGRGERKET